MITTVTEIKHVENSFEDLDAIEVNLGKILVEEYEKELSSEINCTY